MTIGCTNPPGIYIADIGGERLRPLDTIGTPSWTRIIAAPGECNVAIPNTECWRLAGRLETWEAEIVILAEGPNGRTEWAGPITQITLQNGQPGYITATGSTGWWSQRGLADDCRYDAAKPDAIDALVRLNNQAMAIDGRAGVTTYVIDKAFQVAEGTYLRGDGIYVSEVARKLYEAGSVVWSEEGRSVICGPPAWGPPLELRESDVIGQPKLIKSGIGKATRAIVFGQGVTGEARLLDRHAEDRSGVLELIAHDDRVSLLPTANRIASEKLAASRTGWILKFDGATELDPRWRFSRKDLIPGRLVTARYNVSGVVVDASFMLSKVTFLGSGAVQIEVSEYSQDLVVQVTTLDNDPNIVVVSPITEVPGAGPRPAETRAVVGEADPDSGGDSVGRPAVPQAGGTGAPGNPTRGSAPAAGGSS